MGRKILHRKMVLTGYPREQALSPTTETLFQGNRDLQELEGLLKWYDWRILQDSSPSSREN